ncbi:hypothetical protein FQR65_LT01273 [Abscondita terminalis]|nr:hypothetical protein FQR65_LT01273 [Abscondita terminalis]
MLKAVKFGAHLKEIRIHLCPKGETSKGIRDFIQKNYVSIKECNPNSPILIRECSGVQPRLWARYEYGKENSVSLTDLNESDIAQKFANLVK